jgi:hypothetical protein
MYFNAYLTFSESLLHDNSLVTGGLTVISVTVFLAWRNGPLVSDIVSRTSSFDKGVKRIVTLVDWRRAEGR